MVFGELPVLGRPINLSSSRAMPTALAVGAGGGCLDIFSFVYNLSLLPPCLWKTVRYRLKYCLKWSLYRKQPTDNQPSKEGPSGRARPSEEEIKKVRSQKGCLHLLKWWYIV